MGSSGVQRKSPVADKSSDVSARLVETSAEHHRQGAWVDGEHSATYRCRHTRQSCWPREVDAADASEGVESKG